MPQWTVSHFVADHQNGEMNAKFRGIIYEDRYVIIEEIIADTGIHHGLVLSVASTNGRPSIPGQAKHTTCSSGVLVPTQTWLSVTFTIPKTEKQTTQGEKI